MAGLGNIGKGPACGRNTDGRKNRRMDEDDRWKKWRFQNGSESQNTVDLEGRHVVHSLSRKRLTWRAHQVPL